MDNSKYGNGKGKLLPKSKETSGGKAHTNKRKLIRNILTITDVLLNQMRVNVCEHKVKKASPAESSSFYFVYKPIDASLQTQTFLR